MRRIIGALIVVGILVVIPAGVQAQRSDTPVDTVYVPAFGPKDTGSIVYSSIILEKDCKYKIVVSGVYQFNVNMDYGYADAQYRMDSSGQYTQRFNSIEFNGERVNADISDIDNHRYTFYYMKRYYQWGKRLVTVISSAHELTVLFQAPTTPMVQLRKHSFCICFSGLTDSYLFYKEV